MKSLVVTSLFVLILQGYQVSGLIDTDCEYDDDCFIEHSYCKQQRVCKCKTGFSQSDDKSRCIATVGAHCTSRQDCLTLTNSDCIQGICTCGRNYVADAKQYNCLPLVMVYNGTCSQDNQCYDFLGGEMRSQCYLNQCQCRHQYHFSSICLANKGLGMPCANASECYINEEQKNKLDCVKQLCSCKSGFQNEGGFCNGGNSLYTSFVLYATIFILNFKVWL